MGSLRSRLKRLTARRGDGSLKWDLSVSFAGHGAQRVFRLLTFLLMTSVLDREAYGIYTVAYLCFEIAMYVSDFGLNVGMIRFVFLGFWNG